MNILGHSTPGVPEPGADCPACHRRVPFPKTEKSPPTKRMGFWVPAENHESFVELHSDTARYLGTYERPFWEYETTVMGDAAILQMPELADFARAQRYAA